MDVSPESTEAHSAPATVKYFSLSNIPREHCITFASWLSASDLVVSSSQWATIAVYARISPDRNSIDETFLRDQTPLQEILSGIMGGKERPNIVGVGGISALPWLCLCKFYNCLYFHLGIADFKGAPTMCSLAVDGTICLWNCASRRCLLRVQPLLTDSNGKSNPFFALAEGVHIFSCWSYCIFTSW